MSEILRNSLLAGAVSASAMLVGGCAVPDSLEGAVTGFAVTHDATVRDTRWYSDESRYYPTGSKVRNVHTFTREVDTCDHGSTSTTWDPFDCIERQTWHSFERGEDYTARECLGELVLKEYPKPSEVSEADPDCATAHGTEWVEWQTIYRVRATAIAGNVDPKTGKDNRHTVVGVATVSKPVWEQLGNDHHAIVKVLDDKVVGVELVQQKRTKS